ncbi:MAG: hypothetical protein V4646_17545 [Pseudomonadota bacterium]
MNFAAGSGRSVRGVADSAFENDEATGHAMQYVGAKDYTLWMVFLTNQAKAAVFS